VVARLNGGGRKAPPPPAPVRTRAVVVGAGFGGIGAAISLRRAGFTDVTVLEQADEVGGTWRDNTYPGCACDIPSQLYSFSFEPNPGWTRSYPSQPEIEAYLVRTVERHGLRSCLRTGATVTDLGWDDASCTWAVHLADGDVLTADVVISATGPLSKPAIPELDGLDHFAGTVFHSARWRHDHDLTGERVAVVGTGASAIQFVPEIARVAGHVDVFQRNAPWVIGRDDRPVPEWKRRLYRRLPFTQRWQRWRTYARQELLALAFLGHERVTARVEQMGTEHIAGAIDDPELREAVTPHYSPGCKRLLISNDWYPTLTRPDVALVTAPIERIVADGVVTADGVVHPADTIVLGTGFAATDFLAPMRVHGRGGVELSQAWHDGAATHLGITVAGFPNLFLLAGPSTGLGHNSVVFMIEAQLHYLLGALRHRVRHGVAALDVRPDVQAASYAEVQRRMGRTVWASGCDSWYRSDDGRIDTLWPGSTVDYWRRTRRFDPRSFVALAPAGGGPAEPPARFGGGLRAR
jgi:cation diffusion facilitator CzcD-associated flavoprotein CzcO